MPTATVLLDTDTTIIRWSAEAQRLLGYECGEAEKPLVAAGGGGQIEEGRVVAGA
ncbi:PAS domain-containing protein [Streptomyces wedmorensis]|uniref:PAS domain-containing protein n=1 Tax=Streptomyces wedmorensis TaxID=43759 RepID=UPI00341A454F